MSINKFFKSLKVRLAIGSILAIACIVLALIMRNDRLWCIIFSCAAVLLVVIINIWFHKDVMKPISVLTGSATDIATGSYGVQSPKYDDNEIGILTDEINDMSHKIAETDKVRTDFISQVSHELRTPLTAITGWAETLAYDPNITGDSERGLRIISKEAGRLTGMVEELLEFTRIQRDRFTLRIEPVDIVAELEDALFTYGELLRSAGIEVRYKYPDSEIPMIPGDPERLKQVFLNILDNAATHGKDGDFVDVSAELAGKYIKITMRDYGRGIPEDELPHVKEKFYKGSSKDRGTGIGLSVCDEIVTRHGGHLDISNAEDRGCIVSIYLPLTNSTSK